MNLESNIIIAPPCVAGRFDTPESPVLTLNHEHALVVHIHRRFRGVLPYPEIPKGIRRAGLQRALLDISRRPGVDPLKISYQKTKHVYHMGSDIPKRSASADAFLETPGKRRVRMGRPILQIGSPEIEDVSDCPLVNIFFCKLYGRRSAVVESHHSLHAVFCGGPVHFPCLLGGQRKGLFTKNMFSRFCGGDCNLGVYIVGRTDIHHRNLRVADNVVPVGRVRLKGKLLLCVPCNIYVHIYNHFLYRNRRGRPEEHGHTCVCDGVCLCHKSGADESDVNSLWVHVFSPFR